jgi:hypothetical protein
MASMRLRQLKLDFVPEQDRLLMRVSTSESQEVLLWLTRRCVKLMWPMMLKMVESSPRVQLAGATAQARAALLDLEHQRAMQSADFSKPYETRSLAHPLGEEPLLVSRIQSRRDDGGAHVLTLLPIRGPGINLTLDESLLHSCCKLFQNAVAKSDWDMKLDFPCVPPEVARSEGARTLN